MIGGTDRDGNYKKNFFIKAELVKYDENDEENQN